MSLQFPDHTNDLTPDFNIVGTLIYWLHKVVRRLEANPTARNINPIQSHIPFILELGSNHLAILSVICLLVIHSCLAQMGQVLVDFVQFFFAPCEARQVQSQVCSYLPSNSLICSSLPTPRSGRLPQAAAFVSERHTRWFQHQVAMSLSSSGVNYRS